MYHLVPQVDMSMQDLTRFIYNNKELLTDGLQQLEQLALYVKSI